MISGPPYSQKKRRSLALIVLAVRLPPFERREGE